MNRLFLLIALSLFAFTAQSQVISIQEARNQSDGTTVTVKGIVTSGAGLGTIRYMQDETAGIAVYDGSFDAEPGDSVTVSGTLEPYNELLEIVDVEFTVHNSGNPLPEPITLTPGELAEEYESQLAVIRAVQFEDGGSEFQANTSYTFTAEGESAEIYVRSDHPLIGTVIPSSPADITGLVSQFSYDDPNSGYQMILRGPDDIAITSSIFLTSSPKVSNISKTGFDVSWTTNDAGSTWLITGESPASLTDTLRTDESVTDHTASITGKTPASMVYYKAMSFNEEDTTESPTLVGATQSESSGEIKVYFTHETEDSVAHDVLAQTLDGTADDTLINYISRAEETIDFAIYNISGVSQSDIAGALNDAAARGVQVRVVTSGSTASTALDDLSAEINVLERPESDNGIMHNKFLAIDAHHSNPDKAIVWTGSTNFTSTNVNEDANNIVIIYDQSLAKTYELEFEEMWGSEGDTPDSEAALFGSEKTDNTPHEFIIGGKRVECYFSPSDNTNAQIISNIDSADHDLSIKTMLITRSDLAYAIEEAHNVGVKTNMITNSEGSNSTFVEDLLSNTLGVHYTHDDLVSGMLHDKTMIVDEGAPDADPLVLTGSHNWSNSANERNDENTLIIHDDTIANLYFQSFAERFLANNGSFTDINQPPVAVNDTVSAEPETDVYVAVLENDSLYGEIKLERLTDATHGNAYISFTNENEIGYSAEAGYSGMDSVQYKVSYKADENLSDKAWVFFDVSGSSAIGHVDKVNQMKVYPNPGNGVFNIKVKNNRNFPAHVQILDIQGKRLFQFDNLLMNSGKTTIQIDIHELQKGIYLLKIISRNYVHTKKLFIR